WLMAKPRDVARAIADHRQRLLGERGDDELAAFADGTWRERLRIDHLEEKVILPAVQAGLYHPALAGDARPQDFRQAVEVHGLDAELILQHAPHRLAPGLRPEHADPQR